MPSGMHQAWLAQLRADGRLIELEDSITRGRAFAATILYEADLSADSFSCGLRLFPNGEGDLITATVTVGSFEGGVTPVNIALPASQVYEADTDFDHLVWYVFELVHTPAGGDAYTIGGGEIPVKGKVV